MTYGSFNAKNFREMDCVNGSKRNAEGLFVDYTGITNCSHYCFGDIACQCPAYLSESIKCTAFQRDTGDPNWEPGEGHLGLHDCIAVYWDGGNNSRASSSVSVISFSDQGVATITYPPFNLFTCEQSEEKPKLFRYC